MSLSKRAMGGLLCFAFAVPTALAAQVRVIPIPPHAVLRREMRMLERSDPQLAAQVRPGRRLDPAECVVLLGLFEGRNGAERAHQRRAQRAWRLVATRTLGEQPAAQLIASSVNMLRPTPPGLRQNAASWCLANLPRTR